MAKKLLIIESPNKIKTLSKFLDKDSKVLATIGHIRDLSKFGIGFNTETFEPKWTYINNKNVKDIVKEIKEESKNADEIYLATDPDREGEAIAWHVFDIIDKDNQKKCKRITFNEITKTAFNESFNNKRDINMNWVYSQFTRRFLDRLIGYKLSRLMQTKLKADSAGRVQSVALKFICEREKEIDNFISKKWFNIDVIIDKKIPLTLIRINDNKIKNFEEIKKTGFNFKTKEDAEKILNSLSDEFIVRSISKPIIITYKPKPAYKTSTLQQEAINKLNMSSKQVTLISQKLYEGVEIDGTYKALISYPRTDSVRLSNDFISNTKKYIKNKYGEEYVGNYEQTNLSKNVQDAHEAIRPVDIFITPETLKSKIDSKEWELYNLIWMRSVACLMAKASYKKIVIEFENNNNFFQTSSRKIDFLGYQILLKNDDDEDEEIIDDNLFYVSKICKSNSKTISEHNTLPPARYTQASLISALENSGVGRPSTYNTMANISLIRGYAILEKRSFVSTEIGKNVFEQLNNYFNDIINVDFTKNMEETLDKIASGKEEWTKTLEEFMPNFNEKMEYAYKNMEKIKDETTGEKCPDCNNDLLYRFSRKNKSKFIGCSNYPKCKYIRSINVAKETNDNCPICGKLVLIRTNKKNSEFIGCSGFPNCNYLLSMKNYKLHKETKPNESLPIIENKKTKNKTN